MLLLWYSWFARKIGQWINLTVIYPCVLWACLLVLFSQYSSIKCSFLSALQEAVKALRNILLTVTINVDKQDSKGVVVFAGFSCFVFEFNLEALYQEVGTSPYRVWCIWPVRYTVLITRSIWRPQRDQAQLYANTRNDQPLPDEFWFGIWSGGKALKAVSMLLCIMVGTESRCFPLKFSCLQVLLIVSRLI